MTTGSRAPSLRRYLLTWVALLALLALTLGVAYVPLGAVNVALNIGIAGAKALLVMAVFMHLSGAGAVNRLAAAAGFLWLLILLGPTLGDYLTR